MKTITVQIYTNRINEDIEKYLEYAYLYNKKHGIELHFDIARVDVNGYKSVQVPIAGGGSGYVLTGAESLVGANSSHDVTMFLFDLNEWKAPWYSFYPLNAEAPRSSCIISGGKPFINLAMYSRTAQDIQNTKVTFIHELMHSYCKISNTYDQMDSYYRNDEPDAPDGNFNVEWRLLDNWLNPLFGTEQSTVDLIAGFEGFSAKPYRDVAGNWTIGYGFTTMYGIPVVAKTPPMTEKEAKIELAKKIGTYGDAVKQATSAPLNQNQFDACVSLCYNIGVTAFKSSTVARQINLKNYQAAADAFLLWNRAGGKIVQGLKNRRQKERNVFLSK